MINVGELMTDPDFVQTLNVTRQTITIVTSGAAAGETDITETSFTIQAVQTPLNDPNVLAQLPEGARNMNCVYFYSGTELFAADGDDSTGATPMVIDIVEYGGDKYKIYAVDDYSDYGYWKCIGCTDKRFA